MVEFDISKDAADRAALAKSLGRKSWELDQGHWVDADTFIRRAGEREDARYAGAIGSTASTYDGEPAKVRYPTK